jgi:gamma-glutamyl hercynylcysteine S-oxide synthase
MVTRCPSRRKIRAQRSAATALPVRVLGPGGVIIAILMDQPPDRTERPTSDASLAELALQLRETRARTHRLTDELSLDQLMGPQLDIVNPVLWEVGHVGWFHEYWTLRHSHGQSLLIERADDLWNSSTVAHDTRWNLSLPDRDATLAYLGEVLERQCDHLARCDFPERARYFYELAIRHEDMHVEALTYMRETLAYPAPHDLGEHAHAGVGALPGDAEVPGGTWSLGAATNEGFIFDNEKWAHPVNLKPFRISRAPITNQEFAAFVEGGGYRAREFWSTAGWAWRERERAERPVYWQPKSDGVWTWRRYDRIEVLSPDAPVAFVNWYEAEAWCNWAKRRLPTEAEWEASAIGETRVDGSGLGEAKRRWPWGDAAPTREHANLDFAFGAPLDVAGCPAGDSAFGCRQMIGNIWEWTASDFIPFPGFAPDPYKDYSQPWFGSRKVLRGGCWATSARIARPIYRNFFSPDRSDVFAGFRTCALSGTC